MSEHMSKERLDGIEARAKNLGAVLHPTLVQDLEAVFAEVRRLRLDLGLDKPDGLNYNAVQVEYSEGGLRQMAEASYPESVEQYGKWPIVIAADPNAPIRSGAEALALAEALLADLGRQQFFPD